jgi:hypothetical protein
MKKDLRKLFITDKELEDKLIKKITNRKMRSELEPEFTKMNRMISSERQRRRRMNMQERIRIIGLKINIIKKNQRKINYESSQIETLEMEMLDVVNEMNKSLFEIVERIKVGIIKFNKEGADTEKFNRKLSTLLEQFDEDIPFVPHVTNAKGSNKMFVLLSKYSARLHFVTYKQDGLYVVCETIDLGTKHEKIFYREPSVVDGKIDMAYRKHIDKSFEKQKREVPQKQRANIYDWGEGHKARFTPQEVFYKSKRYESKTVSGKDKKDIKAYIYYTGRTTISYRYSKNGYFLSNFEIDKRGYIYRKDSPDTPINKNSTSRMVTLDKGLKVDALALAIHVHGREPGRYGINDETIPLELYHRKEDYKIQIIEMRNNIKEIKEELYNIEKRAKEAGDNYVNKNTKNRMERELLKYEEKLEKALKYEQKMLESTTYVGNKKLISYNAIKHTEYERYSDILIPADQYAGLLIDRELQYIWGNGLRKIRITAKHYTIISKSLMRKLINEKYSIVDLNIKFIRSYRKRNSYVNDETRIPIYIKDKLLIVKNESALKVFLALKRRENDIPIFITRTRNKAGVLVKETLDNGEYFDSVKGQIITIPKKEWIFDGLIKNDKEVNFTEEFMYNNFRLIDIKDLYRYKKYVKGNNPLITRQVSVNTVIDKKAFTEFFLMVSVKNKNKNAGKTFTNKADIRIQVPLYHFLHRKVSINYRDLLNGRGKVKLVEKEESE